MIFIYLREEQYLVHVLENNLSLFLTEFLNREN